MDKRGATGAGRSQFAASVVCGAGRSAIVAARTRTCSDRRRCGGVVDAGGGESARMTRERGQRRCDAGRVCCCRCASVSGVGVAVADDLALRMLQRGRERARGKGAYLQRKLERRAHAPTAHAGEAVTMLRRRRASVVDAVAGELRCCGEARCSEHAGRRTHLKELRARQVRERRAGCQCSWQACMGQLPLARVLVLVQLAYMRGAGDAAECVCWCWCS